MSTIESPLNRAHRHAANADLWLSQGLWVKASEEHAKAADAFMVCMNASPDDNTKRTLFLLHEKHLKQSKELQRKIARLREDGKDPTLPQRPPPLQRGLPPTPAEIPAYHSTQVPREQMQGPIDDSYLMLGQKTDLSASFTQFWKLLEGMLDQLSQPVAFATAPLPPPVPSRGPVVSPLPGSSDSETGEPSTSQPRRTPVLKQASIDDDEAVEIDDAEWGADSDESFYVVPEKTNPSTQATKSDTLTTLQEENAILKAKLGSAVSRVTECERVLKERLKYEQQLRDGILQAQRVMSASQVFHAAQGLPSPPFTANSSQLGLNTAAAAGTQSPSDPHLMSRITELEEKLRVLQVQDLTQKATIAKYKDRWDKVKESMKKKKVAKAAAEAELSARQNRIEEEAEPE